MLKAGKLPRTRCEKAIEDWVKSEATRLDVSVGKIIRSAILDKMPEKERDKVNLERINA